MRTMEWLTDNAELLVAGIYLAAVIFIVVWYWPVLFGGWS